MTIDYLHLPPCSPLPAIGRPHPFKAVLVLEQAVAQDWQDQVSKWLVRSGCLYMMAWGVECSSWDDSVDWANITITGLDDIPDDQFVMTTWHDDELLAETFWFAGSTAHHPTVSLEEVTIIDIGLTSRKGEMLGAYAAAQILHQWASAVGRKQTLAPAQRPPCAVEVGDITLKPRVLDHACRNEPLKTVVAARTVLGVEFPAHSL